MHLGSVHRTRRAIGLFDVKGLTDPNPSFGLGAPLFDRVTIHLNDRFHPGRQFVISTEGNTGESACVDRYELNGHKLDGIRIPFSDVVRGGELKVFMQKTAPDGSGEE